MGKGSKLSGGCLKDGLRSLLAPTLVGAKRVRASRMRKEAMFGE